LGSYCCDAQFAAAIKEFAGGRLSNSKSREASGKAFHKKNAIIPQKIQKNRLWAGFKFYYLERRQWLA
jgi:hypothetical protein